MAALSRESPEIGSPPGPSVEVIGSRSAVRWLGEMRFWTVRGEPMMEFASMQGAMELVAVCASQWFFSLAEAGVSIRWGDPARKSDKHNGPTRFCTG